jgi:para-aminobenzoate synthetase component 1
MAKSMAVVADQLLTDPVELADSPAALNTAGNWVVLAGFEGKFRAVRFASAAPLPNLLSEKFKPVTNWRSSLNADQYQNLVREVQSEIASGHVYQVNLCRILTAELGYRPNATALWQRIMKQHHSKYAGFINLEPGELDADGLWFVSASPELYLELSNSILKSAPIKGTAIDAAHMLDKDKAENVMITDMVRNDLGKIAEVGSVKVDRLLELEQIPGLVQLVSTISAKLRPGISWPEIFAATFPPASVTGAPKLAAMNLISKLEPTTRSAYCGGFGLVQPDFAQLAVGIRSFEYLGGQLRFGTGAGITFGSDPVGEWEETQLKAKRLIQIVSEDD